MRERSIQINWLINVVILITVFILPFLVIPSFTDYFDFPKLIFLLISVLILLILRSIAWVLEGKVLITKTPLDLPIILIILVAIASSLVGPHLLNYDRNLSVIGNWPRIHGSAVTWLLYGLFFFLLTFSLKTKQQLKLLLITLIFSTSLISLISIMSFFGVYLPIYSFSSAVNFNPTGSSFEAEALILLSLPLVLFSVIRPGRLLNPIVSSILASLLTLSYILIGNYTSISAGLMTFIPLLIVYLLVWYSNKDQVLSSLKKNFNLYLPLIIGLITIFAMAFPGSQNLVHQKELLYPQQVNLDLVSSWKVSASAFRDLPLLGSGPTTYLYDFTLYKPEDLNLGQFWNIRFDSAFNEFLQTLATTGLLGEIALIFFAIILFKFAWSGLKNKDDLSSSLSISGLMVLVLLLIHVSSTVSLITSLIILAGLLCSRMATDQVEELTLGLKAWNPTKSDLISGDALPSLILIIVIIFITIIILMARPVILADLHHRNGLNAVSTNALTTYNEFILAEQLNAGVDLYHTDLAQTNFALASSIASSKSPTQASPSGSLTDLDKQNIQTLLSQAINEGRVAVTLNPLSAQNWEILGSIYRQITGVASNALQFSLEAYSRAITQDPLNAQLRLNVGGIYYSVKNYDLAIRFFTDTVNLRPDLANGWYNLAVTYRDKGDLTSAIASAQKTLSLITDTKSSDYQVASQLLKDLQLAQKTATSSGNLAAPTSENNGVLQQKNLPNVLSLPQPSSISTPGAAPKQ